MEPMEVIDLSSDEEKSPPKKPDIKPAVNAKKTAKSNIPDNCEDVEIVYNVPNNPKRTCESVNLGPTPKKPKLFGEESSPKIVSNLTNKKSEVSDCKKTRIAPVTLSKKTALWPPKSDTANDETNSSSITLNGNNAAHFENELEPPDNKNNIDKPQLLVKDRITVFDTLVNPVSPSAEVLESFLDVCRSKDSTKDMEIIINKLKKRYNNLNPGYARSGSFIELIRRKTISIEKDQSKIFLFISEVMSEMKARQIEVEKEIDDAPEENLPDEEVSRTENTKENAQLQALELAMRRCRRRIIKCEMAEVDFDDENDSHYIMAEKYKQRMIHLYNKQCEITKERPDAGRQYLRPKQLQVTPFQPLNNAITSFINKQIIQMNKSAVVSTKTRASRTALTDALIFPDFVDILNCVKKCNEEHDLKWNKTMQESIAKTAFSGLGKSLQHYRRLDYYDTFSQRLDEGDADPALEDNFLAEKLASNDKIGKKNLENILQEFVDKQHAIKPTTNEPELAGVADQETDHASSEGTDDEDSDTSDTVFSADEDSDSNKSETNDINTELQDDVDDDTQRNKETMEKERRHNTQTAPLLEKIDENSTVMHNSALKVIKVIDNVEVTTETEREVISPAGLQNEEVNCVAIDRPTVIETTNDSINPDNAATISPLSSPAQKKASPNKVVGAAEKTSPSSPTQKQAAAKETVATAAKSLPSNLVQKEASTIEIVATVAKTLSPKQVFKQALTKDMLDASKENLRVNLAQNQSPTNSVVDNSSRTLKTSPSLSPIQKPASTIATCEVNLMQATKTQVSTGTDGGSANASAVNIKVIDASAVTPTIELSDEEEEKKPVLRLRQFAKLPGSWKDSQSPTQSIIVEGLADPDRAEKKLQIDSQPRTLIKLNKPTNIGRSVQVRTSDILANLKNKSATIFIPKHLSRNNSQINVNTVTTNVTLNLTTPSQLDSKTTSVVSYGLKPAQNMFKIDSSENMNSRADVGVLSIANNDGRLSPKSNSSKGEESSKQQIYTIKKTSNQVGEPVSENKTQQRIQISSAGHQQRTFVNNGKTTIYRIVSFSPNSTTQNVILPTKADVQNRTANSTIQECNSISTVTGDPNLKLQGLNTNSIKKTLSIKVPGQTSDTVVDKLYEEPIANVPTYVVE